MSAAQLSIEELAALTVDLRAISAGVEKDDLSRLAKMHGFCESILAGCSGSGEMAAFEAVARQVLGHLENLILGQCDDAEAALGDVGLLVEKLMATVADPSAVAGGAASESSSVVEAVNPQAAQTDNKAPGTEIAEATDETATGAGVEPGEVEPDADLGDVNPLTASSETIAACMDQLFASPDELAMDESAEAGAAEATVTEDEATADEAAAASATDDAADAAAEVMPAGVAPEALANLDAIADDEGPKEAAAPYVSEPLLIDAKELEFVTAFIEEAGEHLEAIEGALLDVERSGGDQEKINDLFRPFHTIKGMAGFLNLRDVSSLTHEVETLLDEGRRGEREINGGIVDLIFEAVDLLKSQITSIGNYVLEPTGQVVPQPPVAEMIDRLRVTVASPNGTPPPAKHKAAAATPAAPALVEEAVQAADAACEAQASEAVAAVATETPAAAPLPTAAPSRMPTGGLETPDEAPTRSPNQASLGDQSVRIDTSKLDMLVDMVGELVIAQTLVAGNHRIQSDTKLSKDVGQVVKIVRDLQEVALGMRMIPIKSTFQRMARLVRDLSRKAGKQVDLSISGEDTELDKNVIQQIGDPLVHMVRNAVDHGIEQPNARREAGKNEVGRVHLGAYHHGGNIVIEITDDGKGLDPKALITKGIERGIVSPEDELSDEEAFQLIFAAGFSTAEKITDISGRGVGMDVVKRNIEQLRGNVDITSTKGEGSTFSIRLPLTLAIIDGMVVRIGRERFIIPTIAIEQALRPTASQITTVQHRGEVLKVRGKLIPLVQTGELFDFCPRVDPCDAMVVIVNCDGRQVGLVVEELLGQQQVVIKSLGEKFATLRGISGAAILGDGRVGLILEAAGLEGVYLERQSGSSCRSGREIQEAFAAARDEQAVSAGELAECGA